MILPDFIILSTQGKEQKMDDILEEALKIAKETAIRLHEKSNWRVPRAKFTGSQMEALFAAGWTDAQVGNFLVAPKDWDPGSLVF